MTTDQLSTTLSALADPTRREILARLTLGEASVTELARPFEISLPAVSKHLKVLERAGVIERRVEGRNHWIRVNKEALRAALEWLSEHHHFWATRLDQLEDLVGKK
jgi:DNA-binding transcriptional ArsR family regulator